MVIYNCSNCRGGRAWTLPRWIGSILQLERQSTCCTLGFRWLGEPSKLQKKLGIRPNQGGGLVGTGEGYNLPEAHLVVKNP